MSKNESSVFTKCGMLSYILQNKHVTFVQVGVLFPQVRRLSSNNKFLGVYAAAISPGTCIIVATDGCCRMPCQVSYYQEMQFPANRCHLRTITFKVPVLICLSLSGMLVMPPGMCQESAWLPKAGGGMSNCNKSFRIYYTLIFEPLPEKWAPPSLRRWDLP